MMRITKIQARRDYVLDVMFEDGVHGEISLSDRLFGPMFEPLRDPAFFARASVDAFGAVCWPNGADIAPDAVYSKIVSKDAVR